MKKNFAVIVAGGSGKRMKAPLSKQFMLLWDKPILMHTLLNFAQSKHEPEIILVLPPEDLNTWEILSEIHSFHKPHFICTGGANRAESVLSGLKCLAANFPKSDTGSLVAVHDGVRPLATTAFIDHLFKEARRFGNAIPVLPCRESVRTVKPNALGKGTTTYSMNRDELRFVQTPQIFRLRDLNRCYFEVATHNNFRSFTDDASLVEACGYSLHLSEGKVENIKITYPDDLLIAEALMGRK